MAPLPESFASLSFLVEDVLKAYPDAIRVGEVPVGEPLRKKIYLYTVNDSKAEKTPSLRVLGDSSIKATIAAGARAAPDVIPRDFKVKYIIDVTVNPGRGEQSSAGTVEVLAGDKTMLSIPVECWYKQTYRLSASRIDVEGRPGQSMVRELFFESDSPAWKQISIASSPEGVRRDRRAIRRSDAGDPRQDPEPAGRPGQDRGNPVKIRRWSDRLSGSRSAWPPRG